MKNNVLFGLTLLGLIFFSSCSTTKEYGSLHKKFSEDRIAHFNNDVPRNTYKNNTPRKKSSKTVLHYSNSNVTSSYSSSKVMYHSERNNVLREANKYQGIPYAYGGKSPDKGFDCSGFVTYVYGKQGVMINGNAQSLSKVGRRKSPKDLVKGDLVFFGEGNKISHVGIITLNDGKNLSMIHSSSTGGIRADNITHSDYWRPKLLFGTDVISAFLEEEM